MKYFISQPMNGLTEEEISTAREGIINHIKALDSEAEIIDSYIDSRGEDLPALWYLGESIKRMADADIAVFAEGFSLNRGCRIEYECAKEYGITMLVNRK